ncbi:O-antigen ligase family protein [Chamaesiphon sp. VAR_69_metabat_338]|uniref:O-antigen ligase family protein n=1 Tax=Chamaesiphon sp. VAR_69_metabat_338 TaxID=2964704 RepID=UPI00286D9A97|nr:O-antigen ligase family protein [Chamaesiphon sp. VAR_69_metabat_338]
MPNLLALIPGSTWKHPHPRLQQAWNFARIGFLIFPVLPAIGVFPIFFALVLTWKNATSVILAHRVNWLMALWSVWSIGVSLFGVDIGDALLGLANLLPLFAFFAAYSVLIQSTDQLRQLAWILLLSAIPVMLLGFAELWLHWGGDLAIGGTPIHILGLHPGGNPLGRMASLFGYATGLAEYLQMVFVLALGLWVDAWEHRGVADFQESLAKKKPIEFWRSPKIIYLTGFLAICGTALLLTSSRSAWGGAIVSLSIFALYQAWYWWLGLVSAALAIVFSSAYAPSPLKEPLRAIVPRYVWARITDEMYPDRPEALTRVSQFKFAWKLIEERPVTGWGLQSFGRLYQAYSQTWVPQPHNIVLMLSSSLGLPATIGLIAIVGWIVARGTILFLDFPIEWRSSRTIFFTFLIAFGGFIMFNMTDVTLPDLRLNTLAWLLLASICGLYYQSQPSRRSRVTE